jgi:peptidyl-prolyl cis-trans isomerase SurA
MNRKDPYRKSLPGAVAVSILLLIGAAHASPVTVDRIVAVVNDEIITLSELEEAAAEAKIPVEGSGLPAVPRLSDSQDQSSQNQKSKESRIRLWRDILNKMIEKKLQLQLAKKKGISVSPEELQAALEDIKKRNNFPTDQALKDALAAEHVLFEQYKEDLKDQLLILKLVNREVRSGILIREDELLDYYKRHADSFAEPESFKISQIFFVLPSGAQPTAVSEVRTKALHVLELLQKGGSFQELAKQYSEGPGAASGGNLGYFKHGQLLPEIEQAVVKLQVGQVSGLIQSSIGFHILRLDDKKQAQPKPFEEVKEAVRESVYQQRSDELYQRWIKDIWANAFVEVKLQD